MDSMKNIQDSIRVPGSIAQAKKDSLDDLCLDSNIRRFMKENNLNREDMDEYWLELLTYSEDYPHCLNCRGIQSCTKRMPGYNRELSFEDNKVTTIVKPCIYQIKFLEDESVMNLIQTNMPRNLFKKGFGEDSSNISMKLSIELLKMLSTNEKGVYVYGPTQIGKTVSLGYFAYYYAKNTQKTVAMYNVPALLGQLKSSFNDEEVDSTMILNRIKEADLLILDDLGGENFSPWSRDEIISTIIEERNLKGLVTCYTSVYSLSELKDYYTTRQKGDNIKATRLAEKIRTTTKQVDL